MRGCTGVGSQDLPFVNPIHTRKSREQNHHWRQPTSTCQWCRVSASRVFFVFRHGPVLFEASGTLFSLHLRCFRQETTVWHPCYHARMLIIHVIIISNNMIQQHHHDALNNPFDTAPGIIVQSSETLQCLEAHCTPSLKALRSKPGTTRTVRPKRCKDCARRIALLNSGVLDNTEKKWSRACSAWRLESPINSPWKVVISSQFLE